MYLLFFTCAFIFCSYMQNTIGINIKNYFNLRYTSWCRRNTIKIENTKALIILCHRTFTLQYMNLYTRLVIAGCMRILLISLLEWLYLMGSKLSLHHPLFQYPEKVE